MNTVRISEYRSHLSLYHKDVLENHEPLRVVGNTNGDLVLISVKDYEELLETIGILKDKATMNSLLESKNELFNDSVEGEEMGEAFIDVMESEDQ